MDENLGKSDWSRSGFWTVVDDDMATDVDAEACARRAEERMIVCTTG